MQNDFILNETVFQMDLMHTIQNKITLLFDLGDNIVDTKCWELNIICCKNAEETGLICANGLEVVTVVGKQIV